MKPKSEKTGNGSRATPEDIRKRAESYFTFCDGEAATDQNGDALLSPKGEVVWQRQPKPYTLSGLALALGFAGRAEMEKFASDSGCKEDITRAVSRVEEYAETRLYDRDGLNGAKFTLSAAFGSWGGAETSGDMRIEVVYEGGMDEYDG